MQQQLILANDGPVGMHWGPAYPRYNGVYLMYFEGDDNPYVCRVVDADDLGGNLVSLGLQRARLDDPRGRRDTVSFNLYGGQKCTIRAWESLGVTATSDEEWYDFLDRRRAYAVWASLDERQRSVPQPVPDGQGGYTRATIEYSLSRSYEGP